MTHIFSNRKVFAAIAVLFAAAAVLQNVEGETPAAPSGLTLMELFQPDAHNVGIETLASGPTMPPGPWEEEGPSMIASGPTMPPGPWEEEGPMVASGPTMPPGPWEEEGPVSV